MEANSMRESQRRVGTYNLSPTENEDALSLGSPSEHVYAL